MITNYEVKNIDNEKVLVLYLDFSLEIGSFDSKQKESFLSTVKNYIDKLNLKENYQKIILMSGSILAATLLYTSNDVRWLSSLNNKNSSDIVVNIDIKPSSNFNKEQIELPEIKDNDNLVIEEKDLEQQENQNKVQKEEKINPHKQEINVKTSTNKEEIKQENVSVPTTNVNNDSLTNKNNQTKDELNSSEQNIKVEKKKNMVTVNRSNGTVLEIELEEYIVGVVAAEMPASFSSEALKAQSVVARTYALRKISRGEKLTDTVSTQAYIDVEQMKIKWGSDFSKYFNKIKNAVSDTKGEYITYQGKYINAVYHSTSNGYTEDAVNVWKESYPYLKSVESSWDKGVSSYERKITKDFQNLLDVTGLESDLLEIKILSRNASGRVETVQVGNKTYTGVEFRNLLGLRSADFDIEINDNNIEITTRGFGHGVGMSQYGANEMSKQGFNYKQIIKHYYIGVEIQK